MQRTMRRQRHVRLEIVRLSIVDGKLMRANLLFVVYIVVVVLCRGSAEDGHGGGGEQRWAGVEVGDEGG